MSGVAYKKILTLFPNAKEYVFDKIKPGDAEVHFCGCFLTKTHYIEYRFHDQEVFDKFLTDSGWNKLPSTNKFNFKYFNFYENNKFKYVKNKNNILIL